MGHRPGNGWGKLLHPGKSTWNRKKRWFERWFSFSFRWFVSSMLIFRGVYFIDVVSQKKAMDKHSTKSLWIFGFPKYRGAASLPGKPASGPNSIQPFRQVTMLTWNRDGRISWTGYLGRSPNLNSHGNAAAAAEFGMALVMKGKSPCHASHWNWGGLGPQMKLFSTSYFILFLSHVS